MKFKDISEPFSAREIDKKSSNENDDEIADEVSFSFFTTYDLQSLD